MTITVEDQDYRTEDKELPMWRIWAVIGIILLSHPGIVNADAIAECNGVLQERVYQSDNHVIEDRRLARTVTEQGYDNMEGLLGGAASLYGIQLAGGFTAYSNAAQGYAEESTTDAYQLIYSRMTDPGSVKAYSNCLSEADKQALGIHLYVVGGNSAQLVVEVFVNLPIPDGGLDIKWSSGSNPVPPNLPSHFSDRGEYQYVVQRPSHTESIAANYKGVTSEILTLGPLPTDAHIVSGAREILARLCQTKPIQGAAATAFAYGSWHGCGYLPDTNIVTIGTESYSYGLNLRPSQDGGFRDWLVYAVPPGAKEFRFALGYNEDHRCDSQSHRGQPATFPITILVQFGTKEGNWYQGKSWVYQKVHEAEPDIEVVDVPENATKLRITTTLSGTNSLCDDIALGDPLFTN